MADVEFSAVSGKLPRDERGFAFFPWPGEVRDPGEILPTCHLVSIQPGHTRGNHYHPGHEEWLFAFHGDGIITWEAAGEIREQRVSGEGTLIRIPPGIAHAVTNPGPEVLYLLAWRQAAGEGPGEPETVARLVGSNR
jgi:oxalate decarboxylase/phosphoglucose isomerase-like protein (cupin superfamily)